ncbi:MAG: hypothetical protein JNL08_04190 [Planctomycetes bacterium]|nr:hypothetical protein [Planctomycetota bacterium]
MKHVETVALLALATILVFPACGGGGDSSTPSGTIKTGGDFVVLNTSPTNGGRAYLNDAVSIDFSQPVDLDSASLQTISFQALDQVGNPISELVSGTFQLAASPGDASVGRRLQFVPKFPEDNAYTTGGFRAGRTYLVSLVGGAAINGTVLRDRNGKGLAQPLTFRFSTVDGTQAGQLFRNPKSGGPTRTAFQVTTADSLTDVPLNVFGRPPLEVRLHFDQALNPNDGNVPVNFDTNPLVRDQSKRGRIYLEYENTVLGPGAFTWIPADVSLEQNDLNGAIVALRPVGVLPNNATVRAVVANTLEDISGESNVAIPGYDEVFGTFKTDSSYAPQWNGIVEDFANTDLIDFTAAFAESQSDVGAGFVRAGFAFEGNPTSLEYEPTATEVVLNTAFTQIQPKNGLPFTVSGGVFNFKNVRIPNGVNVIGTGPNPMVWLCSGSFTVEGNLSVRGGNGARVDTLNSANFAKAGGIGVCGGGNGGDGTPKATQRDLRGDTGRGPLQVAGKGGRGGYNACLAGQACYTGTGYDGSGGGSGGGGGALATQGDPLYRPWPTTTILPNTPPTANTGSQQVLGYGCSGCSGTSGARSLFLPGGEPGDLAFVDSRHENNFWGSAVRLSPSGSLRITGELSVPMGGGGGGGGGDTVYPTSTCNLTSPDPTNDFSGGGGGGGGGVLIVKALGEIVITSTGKIVADGGNGGGGEQAGACGEAGGGGGGAGGMVVLMSATRIVLHAHGSAAQNRYTYGPTVFGQNDYDFAISADGGVTTTGVFGSVVLTGKYPASGTAMMAPASYDGEPLGGLGGMGVIQLMVPPGDNSDDNTNTRLDDNIRVVRTTTGGSQVVLTGAEKRAILGWRGFPGTNGIGVDDFGGSTNYNFNNPSNSANYAEGDMRPAPVLMPVPFSAQSRVRSKWIDTGVSKRRELGAPDGLPAGIVGAAAGPNYEFGGIDTQPGDNTGYVRYLEQGTSVAIDYGQPVVGPVAIQSTNASGTFLGQPAYRVTVTGTPFAQPDRFVQYEAQLLDIVGSEIGSFRILAHTTNELVLDPGAQALPTGAKELQVVAKFFKVVTGGAEGLGPVYQQVQAGGAVRVIPRTNVRIGFAFHQDPKNTTNRFPADAQQFLYDLQDTGFTQWVAANGAPRYVQYDVTFDLRYENNSQGQALTADTPRPELHFLRLPFRF